MNFPKNTIELVAYTHAESTLTLYSLVRYIYIN